MIVSDFVLQVKDDLQEKSTHWTVESLLLKLQDAYIDLQFDLPYFMAMEDIAIEQGKSEYYLKNVFLKNISFVIGGVTYEYTDMDNLFMSTMSQKVYSHHNGKIMLNQLPQKDMEAKIAYKYQKTLKNKNCHIETPANWKKALEYLFKAYIYEKPTRNTKERDLNKHYLSLYKAEVRKLKEQQKAREKNITSKYQIV
jgi:hypothetical protein